jgi:hypothetical protein
MAQIVVNSKKHSWTFTLDSLDLLIVFCKKIVYIAKQSMDHFPAFIMVHKMGFSWISLVKSIDAPI